MTGPLWMGWESQVVLGGPYLKELAEEEACSREAGADPRVTGGEWFFGLQSVLEPVHPSVRPTGSPENQSRVPL